MYRQGNLPALGPSVEFMVAIISHSKPPLGTLVRLAHTSTELSCSSTVYSEDTTVTVASVGGHTTKFIII